MKKIAYIDAQNIHKSLLLQSITIDREMLFLYMQRKYNIEEIKIFFWYKPDFDKLYTFLKSVGYTVVFKKVYIWLYGEIKGNVDIDVALHVCRDFYEWLLGQLYLMTGDGDYNTLIDFAIEKGIFGLLLYPWYISTANLLLRESRGKNSDLSQIHYIKKLPKEGSNLVAPSKDNGAPLETNTV